MNKKCLLALCFAILPLGCVKNAPADKAKIADAPKEPEIVNLLHEGGFEAPSKEWVYSNRPENFKRVSSDTLPAASGTPRLGAYVIKVDEFAPTEAHPDAPPYIIQKITFRDKPEKVVISADVLYIGPEHTKRGIRFSFRDPDVKYHAGSGNVFPYKMRWPLVGGQWSRLEWTANISKLNNQTLTFGIMFFHEKGVCYLDNVVVTPVISKAVEVPPPSGAPDAAPTTKDETGPN